MMCSFAELRRNISVLEGDLREKQHLVEEHARKEQQIEVGVCCVSWLQFHYCGHACTLLNAVSGGVHTAAKKNMQSTGEKIHYH